MKIELFYRLMLHDNKGKLVKDTGLIPSKSYVLQFLKLIRGSLRAGIYLSGYAQYAIDVNYSSQVIVDNSTSNYYGRVNAGIGVDTYGIVVGTNDGSTPESNTDYKLDTKILHSGTGESGKLNYRNVTIVVARVVGGNVDLDVARPFINETGVTITVKEIGLICESYGLTGPAWHFFLLLRDVVPDFAVETGKTLTVVYTLRTTV